MKRETKIEWRERSQAAFLPDSDLRWTEFFTVVERVSTKDPPIAAELVVRALNAYQGENWGLFEYRQARSREYAKENQ